MTPEEAIKLMRDAVQGQIDANVRQALMRAQAEAKQRRVENIVKITAGAGAFALLGILDSRAAKKRLQRLAENLADQYLPTGAGETTPSAARLPMFGQGQIKDADFEIVEEES